MFSTYKHFAALLVTSLLLGSSADAQNFHPPILSDVQAPGSSGQRSNFHTGTDVIVSRVTRQAFQVMTWDNQAGDVFVAWATNPNNSNPANTFAIPRFGARLSDPDIVMAYEGNTLYANVVYLATINGTTQTQYRAYRWNGVTFNNVVAGPIALGTSGREHSYPNIDSNKDGKVGIVWQETSTETGTIQINFPSHAGPPVPLTTTFADSYLLQGYINGTINNCRGMRGIEIGPFLSPGQTPTPLNNLVMRPDVAVSNKGIISVSFINNYAYSVPVAGTEGPADPATYQPPTTQIAEGLRLVVNQYDQFCNGDAEFGEPYAHMEWYTGVSGNSTPRIAASNNSERPDDDVEVVLDWKDTPCVEGYGPRTYLEIHNFGKSRGQFRAGHRLVSLPYKPSVSTAPTQLPVVAYYGNNELENNLYVITWSSEPQDGRYMPGEALDVWGRTFTDGEPFQSNPDFSRINGRGDKAPEAPGQQFATSVAARYGDSGTNSVHLFADYQVPQISFKSIHAFPGVGENVSRPAGTTGTTSAGAEQATIQVYPNPSTSAVDFNLHLRAGEVVQQLTVVDQMGRVIDQVATPSSQATDQVLNWTPRRAVPAGYYVVKLVTNQRTENITINRQL